MEASVEVTLLPTYFHGSFSWKLLAASMEVVGNFDGSRSNGSRWTLMEVLWKKLEVCGICVR